MASTGVIFSCIYNVKLLNPWPNSSVSCVVNYGQLSVWPGEMEPLKDYLGTHGCMQARVENGSKVLTCWLVNIHLLTQKITRMLHRFRLFYYMIYRHFSPTVLVIPSEQHIITSDTTSTKIMFTTVTVWCWQSSESHSESMVATFNNINQIIWFLLIWPGDLHDPDPFYMDMWSDLI